MIRIILLLAISTGVFRNEREVPVKNFEALQSRVMHPENDTLYVVNFWATWCKPCIAELPFFESAFEKNQNMPVKILMASLDFKSQIDGLEKFRNDRKLKNEVFLLDAGNPNDWINKVYPYWGGAIPATAFYRSGKMRYFHDGEFSGLQLDSTITAQLKTK